MTAAEYHRSKALSKSAIDLLLECPALYKAWLEDVEEREPTPAMIFGSMCHKLTLEPHEFSAEYAVTDLNLSTKEGKAFKEQAAGRTIAKQADYEAALLMADAVREHPQAKHLFKSYQAERSIFWKNGDIECKARPDIVSTIGWHRYLADLKTCESASPEAIQKSIANYGYYRQAAWYLHGMDAIGEPCNAFIFIFVEKTYPHLVTMCTMTPRAIAQGTWECSEAIDRLKECRKTGLYPCYTRDILQLDLPTWAQKEI